MKLIARIFCIGALLAATTPFAKADALNQISFAGGDTLASDGAVTFYDFNGAAAGNAYTGVATGIFSAFANGAATFHDFNYLTSTSPFVLISDVAKGGLSATFTVTDFVYSNLMGLNVAGNGYYTLGNGTVVGDGAFQFTTQTSGGAVTFSDTNTVAVTPEPNSLMLLGTGLVSAASMLVRRRRLATV